jgi:hypothetical protein
MLFDLQLVSTLEEYFELVGEFVELYPWRAENIFHHPIDAVCISYDPISGSTLAHFPSTGSYTTSMSWEGPLLGVDTGGVATLLRLQERTDGIHIGLQVNKGWWEKQKRLLSDSSIVLTEEDFLANQSVMLTLAVFPSEVLDCYYADLSPERQEENRELLVAKGWRKKRLDDKTLCLTYIFYDHRYLNVHPDRIS